MSDVPLPMASPPGAGGAAEPGDAATQGGPLTGVGSAPVVASNAPAASPIDVDVQVPMLEPGGAASVDAGSGQWASDAAAPATELDAGVEAPGVDMGPILAPQPSDPDRFGIDLVFEEGSTVRDEVLDAFLAAETRWEQVIVGDVPDVAIGDKASCDGHGLPEAVDDIVVYVRVTEFDGPEGVLGAAGPCAIRSRAPRLPFAAAVSFDIADLERFAEAGRLEEVVLHEMGHALGFGSLWEEFGLVDEPSDGSGDSDTAFNGENARAVFDDVTRGEYEGNRVPVENVGSEGEINGHWREDALGSELMTTHMGSKSASLSVITIAALGDMGYEVDLAQADDYAWPSEDPDFEFLAFGGGALADAPFERFHDTVRRPLYELTDDGRLRPLGRR